MWFTNINNIVPKQNKMLSHFSSLLSHFSYHMTCYLDSKKILTMVIILIVLLIFNIINTGSCYSNIISRRNINLHHNKNADDYFKSKKNHLTVNEISTLVLDNSNNIIINGNINTAFSAITFLPQPLWLLMILLPNSTITKKIMSTLLPILTISLIHLFIVITSVLQDSGTAPIAEFAGVFDPLGAPLLAMMGMMKYPNFVSEEWSHVLTWDLFVGQWIWLDGLRRGIFTSHSVLLTNLIGPPGLLLHVITCILTGKGLPQLSTDMLSNSIPIESVSSEGNYDSNADSSVQPNIGNSSQSVLPQNLFRKKVTKKPVSSPRGKNAVSNASTTISSIFSQLYIDPNVVIKNCADDVVWEDTAVDAATIGAQNVASLLKERVHKASSNAPPLLVIDKVTDGDGLKGGFTWHLEESGVSGWGLRGTTYLEIDSHGKISYVREIVEPLFKPGGSTAALLKAVSEQAIKNNPELATTYTKKAPQSTPQLSTAEELVKYLRKEIQPTDDLDLVLPFFSNDIYYEDFNFKKPFIGTDQVRSFLKEFTFPGISFIPEKISNGKNRCCFTWRVEIAGSNKPIRGISFYEINPITGKVIYIRDIPEPALKPAPLLSAATVLQPKLRRFKPLTPPMGIP